MGSNESYELSYSIQKPIEINFDSKKGDEVALNQSLVDLGVDLQLFNRPNHPPVQLQHDSVTRVLEHWTNKAEPTTDAEFSLKSRDVCLSVRMTWSRRQESRAKTASP